MSYKPNFSDAPEFSITPDGEKLFEEITVLFAYYDPFFEEHLADFEDAERALKAALKGQMNIAPQLYILGRGSCTVASLETEQSRRRSCTLTFPTLHGIIDVSKCREE